MPLSDEIDEDVLQSQAVDSAARERACEGLGQAVRRQELTKSLGSAVPKDAVPSSQALAIRPSCSLRKG